MNQEEINSAAFTAAGYAVCYLRKMRQWNEGKIDLQVPGYDPPYRMSNEDIKEEMDIMLKLLASL